MTRSPFPPAVAVLLFVCSIPAPAQTVLLDFGSTGQYTNNFNVWNDVGGTNGGSTSFMESPSGGVGAGGGVSVFQNADTTATYKGGSWNFSTNGAVLFLSVTLKANGQTSGNKVQLGILNTNFNGLNNNAGVAFESYRFVPQSSTSWSLREQYRVTNSMVETALGQVTVVPGRWYKFVMGLTNTGSASLAAGAALYDYGTDGLTPGSNTVTFATSETHPAPDLEVAAVWPGLRATQNAGIDAWDNFQVYALANMAPIDLTGFNRDIIIENTAAGPPYSSAAQEFNPGEGTAFYQQGLPGKSYGLPVNGIFASAFGDATVFRFQPYTGSNALVLSSETGVTAGTLTLTAPVLFSRVAILANSGSGGGSPALTFNFTDGSTFTTNYDAPDWFFNPGFALQGVDRINISSGATSGGPNDPRFYQTTIDLAGALGASNRPVGSITFSKASGAGATAIYAVSGLPAADILPAQISLLGVSSVEGHSVMLSGQVVQTGGEAPRVTVYYGLTNGGTNSGAWSQSAALGQQTGSFSAALSGLVANTQYYFTMEAANSGGTTWTGVSSFQTPLITPPTVGNLAASEVGATYATLDGEIVSSGGEPDSVTVFYGPVDGSTNASAWANSIGLETQQNLFGETVSGLTANTTYYYTARAANSAGTNWATPSVSFTTALTNPPASSVAVLTQHNDLNRSGANLRERVLNTSNVNTNEFGLLYTLPVDDQIYAQPLIVTNIHVVGRGTRNLVIVATVNDSIFAFDADEPSATEPYWAISFLGPNVVAPQNTDMTGACGGAYQDFSGKLGIVGTPVIDPATGTLYVVVRTKENGVNFVQRLHALDVSTGIEQSNSPVTIAATYPGTGAGNVSGVLHFDPQRNNQRPGLALVNGVVYIGWSSHCDWGPYHGWLIGYDAATLKQAVVFNDTPNGNDGGIWMSGQAPAADAAGNLYLTTGNGSVDTAGGPNRGESFLKLTPDGAGGLTIASWFTPYNWQSLENGDIDLGSAGVLLIPGTTLATSGGKQGILYLVNRDRMGGLSNGSADTNAVQSFTVSSDEVHGGPVWWDGPTGSFCYVWPSSVNLQQYKYDAAGGKFLLPATAQSPTAAPAGQPGGILALSANGSTAGSGILWASHQLNGDANQSVRPGILHAYDAQNVSRELWNSEQISARDRVGDFAKFVAPTVANGKVYLATFSNQLNVYGLLPPPTITATVSGSNLVLSWSASSMLNYTLQSSGSLSPANWVNVAGSPSLSNGVYTLRVPMSASAMFYRLKR